MYLPDTKSGAGYFYDDVLEYQVWLHPEKGAKALNGTKDYFVAFAQYEHARAFSETSPGQSLLWSSYASLSGLMNRREVSSFGSATNASLNGRLAG
jgi:hypothetical protein